MDDLGFCPPLGYAPRWAIMGYAPRWAIIGFAPRWAIMGFAPRWAIKIVSLNWCENCLKVFKNVGDWKCWIRLEGEKKCVECINTI